MLTFEGVPPETYPETYSADYPIRFTVCIPAVHDYDNYLTHSDFSLEGDMKPSLQ